MPRTTEAPPISRLIVTRQFALSYERLPPNSAVQLERALRRLLVSPGNSGVRLQPLAFPDGYHELRFGYRDRAILRMEGADAVLVDVASFREIARLNSRLARRLRF
jgi:hypothetical protein